MHENPKHRPRGGGVKRDIFQSAVYITPSLAQYFQGKKDGKEASI